MIVLVFLWMAFVVLTVVAFFAILFTGRYPRAIFDFNPGVLRWTWRVGFYSYGALGTDRYPPFTLADVPDYPARLKVEYPQALSRGLALVKWWLLALPHYLIVSSSSAVPGPGSTRPTTTTHGPPAAASSACWSCIAGIVLLFTGRYPRSIFDFVMGMNRWVFRVAAYAALMTDAYPPFRLDMGDHEPAPDVAGPDVVAPRPAGRPLVTKA